MKEEKKFFVSATRMVDDFLEIAEVTLNKFELAYEYNRILSQMGMEVQIYIYLNNERILIKDCKRPEKYYKKNYKE